jgi:hypothetical protein
MRLRVVGLALVALAALAAWRAELWTVQRPGAQPRPLALQTERLPAAFDVALPAVPVGVGRLDSGAGPLLVHYWAPWERDGRAQIEALDSLARLADAPAVRIVVVCFDPFPSLARFLGRTRVRIPVLLDHERALTLALPCPSLPYTYGIDASGRIAIREPGEIDWLSDSTRAALRRLAAPVAEAASSRAPS